MINKDNLVRICAWCPEGTTLIEKDKKTGLDRELKINMDREEISLILIDEGYTISHSMCNSCYHRILDTINFNKNYDL
ncbi:MAG: hypothetical protein QXJ28_00600 [Candidatus Pacearchaeota archaeon]